MHKQNKFLAISVLLFLLSVSCVMAVSVVNSQDWDDVYAVMLASSVTGDESVFLKSESISAITKTVAPTVPVTVYESSPVFIPNLGSQLRAMGYTVEGELSEDSFYTSLDISDGKYILVSQDNYRIAPSLAPFAKLTNSWVLFVSEENIDEITDLVSEANSVLAVGKFRRDLFSEVQPFITESIDTGSVFTDSVEIAKKFPNVQSVVLSDAKALEAEFFNTETPVLITGTTKLPDETYNYLIENNIKSVVLVGNQLAVIGEEIRTKSQKSISVFIKFGQSDAQQVGSILALSFFPLPVDNPSLALTEVVVDPATKIMSVVYSNTGNVGLFLLSTITLLDGDEALTSVADDTPQYLGAGESLRVEYSVSEAETADLQSDDLQASFFTSYGISPTTLDNFLVASPGSFAPPFVSPAIIKSIEEDGTELNISNVAYYKGLKRIGVTIQNIGEEPAYYSVRVYDVIVNGIEETLDKLETRPLAPGEERITYIPVQLDEVDLLDNVEFDVEVRYGNDEQLVKSKSLIAPFTIEDAINPLLLIGAAIVVLLIISIFAFITLRKKK